MNQIDFSRPSGARVWDHLLEGKNNFAVDRAAAVEINAAFDGWRSLAWMQQRFVDRAVRYLVAEAGIRQIVDVGCGYPLLANVHDTAEQLHPDVRVLYVDNDPYVFSHVNAWVDDDRSTAPILADVTDPAEILGHEVTRHMLDLDEPYAVLLCGVLHHLADEQDPAGICERFTAALPPGGHLVMSGLLDDDSDDATPVAEEAERAWTKVMRVPARFRRWDEQHEFFAGLELVDPGLVYADDWRPDEATPEASPQHVFMCAGIGEKL